MNSRPRCSGGGGPESPAHTGSCTRESKSRESEEKFRKKRRTLPTTLSPKGKELNQSPEVETTRDYRSSPVQRQPRKQHKSSPQPTYPDNYTVAVRQQRPALPVGNGQHHRAARQHGKEREGSIEIKPREPTGGKEKKQQLRKGKDTTRPNLSMIGRPAVPKCLWAGDGGPSIPEDQESRLPPGRQGWLGRMTSKARPA